jgi:hypothetical protein
VQRSRAGDWLLPTRRLRGAGRRLGRACYRAARRDVAAGVAGPPDRDRERRGCVGRRELAITRGEGDGCPSGSSKGRPRLSKGIEQRDLSKQVRLLPGAPSGRRLAPVASSRETLAPPRHVRRHLGGCPHGCRTPLRRRRQRRYGPTAWGDDHRGADFWSPRRRRVPSENYPLRSRQPSCLLGRGAVAGSRGPGGTGGRRYRRCQSHATAKEACPVAQRCPGQHPPATSGSLDLSLIPVGRSRTRSTLAAATHWRPRLPPWFTQRLF